MQDNPLPRCRLFQMLCSRLTAFKYIASLMLLYCILHARVSQLAPQNQSIISCGKNPQPLGSTCCRVGAAAQFCLWMAAHRRAALSFLIHSLQHCRSLEWLVTKLLSSL